MKQATITLGKETLYHIEPNLFAHNLEHTRSCLAGGLSAQMLRNRKFAGKGACASGEAADWYRIGSNDVFMTLNRYDPYVRHYVQNPRERRNELNAQTIQNPNAGEEAGIGQTGLFLKKGLEYEVRTVLKGRGDQPMSCTVRLVAGHTGLIYWQAQIALPQNEWHKSTFVFKAMQEDTSARFEIVFTDRGEVNVGAVSLMPQEHFRGLRRDVIAQLKEIGATVLRWPGGNFAGEYRWKDGLMDVDMRGAQRSFREIETHPYTHGFDFHEMNIDDFIAVCREVDAQPYVTINLAWDTPESCAEFVEYCNGAANTPWGAERAKRGNVEPYEVIFWSLGNEFGLGHMEGPNTPQAYSEKALACAKAMRAKDPRLVLFASGSYNPEFDYAPWLQKSLPALCEEIDYISYHNYVPRLFEGGMDFVTQAGLRSSYETIVNAPAKCLSAVWDLRNAMNKGGDKVASVNISYDEWNLYFAWYHDPCTIEGLYTGLMLEMFIKNYKALKMPMVMYFQPINEGAILVKPYTSELTANGQIFALMKAHIGAELLKSESSDAQVHCLTSVKDGETIVTLINKDFEEDAEIRLETDLSITDCLLYDGGDMRHGSRFAVCAPTFKGNAFTLPKVSILQFSLK